MRFSKSTLLIVVRADTFRKYRSAIGYVRIDEKCGVWEYEQDVVGTLPI